MIECPNCGSNLKFDIETQNMKCSHCSSYFDPYEFEKQTEDEMEKEYFDTTVFTCPQCNGEMFSTDTDATAFCSFCGASNILYSRIQKSRKPKFILPFTKTKEDCKNEYLKYAKNAIFAPKEYKDANCIESFRGIYMPYWYYNISQRGECVIKGKISKRRGDYIYTDHYDLCGNIDSSYKGINYDAASSYADSISKQVAPFDIKEKKDFSPAFLSGFYADTADVSNDVYSSDATNDAYEIAKNEIERIEEFSEYDIDWSDHRNDANALNIKMDNANLAMFPVWFMAHRTKDRVTYATVNGQTGKVVADLPVDIKRYIVGSLLLAAPIFLVLNTFFTLLPIVVLMLTSIIAFISNIIFSVNIGKLIAHEGYEDDKGRIAKAMEDENISDKDKLDRRKYASVNSGAAKVAIYLVLGVIMFFISVFVIAAVGIKMGFLIFCIVNIAIAINSQLKIKNSTTHEYKGLIAMMIAFCISFGTVVLNPVSDIFYYSAVILLMCSILWVIIDIVSYHNLLVSRPIPQFDKQGGDDRA